MGRKRRPDESSWRIFESAGTVTGIAGGQRHKAECCAALQIVIIGNAVSEHVPRYGLRKVGASPLAVFRKARVAGLACFRLGTARPTDRRMAGVNGFFMTPGHRDMT